MFFIRCFSIPLILPYYPLFIHSNYCSSSLLNQKYKKKHQEYGVICVLLVYLLINIYCQKKLLWQGLRYVLINGYKDKNIEVAQYNTHLTEKIYYFLS